MYRTDLSDELYHYHFTIGPVRKSEIPRYVIYNRNQHLHPEKADREYLAIIEKYPDSAVFMDIDIYQTAEQIPTQEAQSFAENARERTRALANELTKYFFSRDMEA